MGREVGASGQVHLEEGSRQGKFYVLWYCGDNKVFTPVPQNNGEKLPELRGALRLAKIKQRHLEDEADGLQRPDPIMPVNRVTIKEAVQQVRHSNRVNQKPAYLQDLRAEPP